MQKEKHRLKHNKRFLEKIVKSRGCWEWTGAIGNSYGHGYFRYKGITMPAHRASWKIYFGEIPKGRCILHRCDNPPCVNPDHLYIGTRKDNVKDRTKRNNNYQPKGENHSLSKLTERKVKEIRKLYKEPNITQEYLSIKFKVSINTIKQVINRITWKHI